LIRNCRRAVHRVAVQDQKDLPLALSQQPPQETQEHRPVESLLEQHEA
jgi:hypothetical protein